MKYRAKHAKMMKLQHFKKSAALLIALALIVTVGVGSTLAYLIDTSSEVTNTFLPTKVSCEVHEKPFDGSEKKEVKIKNTSTTGDVDAYIRAAVIVTWKKHVTENEKMVEYVAAEKPVSKIENYTDYDYEINYNLTDGWVKGADDYYYWTSPVPVNKSTGVLITSCAPVVGKAPSGYNLSVEIVAEAIQAKPITAVTSSWASGVSGVSGTTLQIIE